MARKAMAKSIGMPKDGDSNNDRKLPPSPGRRKKTSPPAKKLKGGSPILKVLAFHSDFTFEALFYEKADGSENYVYGLKEYIRGNSTTPCEYIDGLNIVRYVSQRVPNSPNTLLTTNPNSEWSRAVFIRYPEDNMSTPDTRQEYLRTAKRFFQDTRFSNYPPREIETVDLTNPQNPAALDEYFMDDEIKYLMVEDIDGSTLNPDFTTNYPDFARKCWKFNHFSDWARNNLGFGQFLVSELSSTAEDEK